MDQNKSPFEEIFKKEESRKKEEEKEKGILDALDNEEKSLFEEPSKAEIGPLEHNDEKEGGSSKEKRYRKLLDELVEKKYFEEAINLIGEMKAEFGQ
ncbi:hypothetical protein JW879_02605 [candidate division WOR-3 bacterium]|nr:hypothetical protein [candidate division WOR-3 bacterium]